MVEGRKLKMEAEEEEEDYHFTHDLCDQDALLVSVLSIGMWHRIWAKLVQDVAAADDTSPSKWNERQSPDLYEQIVQFMPVLSHTDAKISYDITTILQQLIADELDNLISTLILATNEITCSSKEVENISQKHQRKLFLSDKEHKGNRIHIRTRNLIRNEQCSQNFTHCEPELNGDGKCEQRHTNFVFKQGSRSFDTGFGKEIQSHKRLCEDCPFNKDYPGIEKKYNENEAENYYEKSIPKVLFDSLGSNNQSDEIDVNNRTKDGTNETNSKARKIKSLVNCSARSFDLPSRQRNKHTNYMYKRQISLREPYFKLHRDYEKSYDGGECKNGNRSCLKIAFSPEETSEKYDYQQTFDIEDQANTEKSCKLLKSWQDNKLQMMSDKMDDERLEMNEKMMKMESKAAEVESNLRQQLHQKEEQLKSTRQFLDEQRLEFENDTLDLENIRNCLKHEQKRADDAVGQIKKLNEEIKSLNNNLEQSWSSEETLKETIKLREYVIDAQRLKIEILQNCQTQNNYKIDGAETEKSTEEENITKNENPVECHSAASNFSPQKNSSNGCAKEIKENGSKEIGYEKDDENDSEDIIDDEDARRAKEFVNLRVHRNSLGVHLSNLLRKDSEEEESEQESSDSSNEKDKSKYSANLSDSSKVGLKHLVLKHLGKLNKNKRSGRKLIVTFDLDSVTTQSSRRRASKTSSNTSDNNSLRYSADEEEDTNSDKGYVNLRLRRDSIAIHLLHLQRKSSEVSNDRSTSSSNNVNHLEPDLLVDNPSSINFVSELLTSENTINPRSADKNCEGIRNSSKIKFSIPSKEIEDIESCDSGKESDHNLLALRESALQALEEIFHSAAEKVISINGCATHVSENPDTSFDALKGSEPLSVITKPKYIKSAKGLKRDFCEKDVKTDNDDVSSSNLSSNCVEGERSHKKESEENGNSKSSSDCFDSDWEFKQDTVNEGKEKLFLSLASHTGKLLSFTDNDQKHDSLPEILDSKIKDIPGCKNIHDLIELNSSLREELHSKCQEVELLNLKLLKEQARGNGRKKNKDIKLHRSRQSNREGVAFASRSQIIDENRIQTVDLEKDTSNIDSSTASSVSYESIHQSVYQNCPESSSNDFTSLAESSSTDDSKSQFTQIENNQKSKSASSSHVSHVVFAENIVIIEKSQEKCISRSISLEPNTTHGNKSSKDTKNIQRGLSLEEELFNEEVIRLNSKSPENIDPEIKNSNLEYSGQTSLINESFEASLASSTCGEDSEEESENNQDDRIDIDFNKEESIHNTTSESCNQLEWDICLLNSTLKRPLKIDATKALMEDKFKNLEYGVKVLSSVAMQRKILPLDADDNQQNNVGSLLSASGEENGPIINGKSECKENLEKEMINNDQLTKNESQRRLSSSSRLNDQERKTRIAFLQNRQAELETEIQLLKQSQEFDKLMTDEPLISDSLLTRSKERAHEVQPDLGPSFSKQSPSKEATYHGIRTIIPSFTPNRNDDVKSQNHKVFKESRSFDLSVLGNPSRALGKQKGTPKIFQCSFDNEDTLIGDIDVDKGNPKGNGNDARAIDEPNSKRFITQILPHQKKEANEENLHIQNSQRNLDYPSISSSIATDSTSNLTGQNSLETQVVNQCSRAMVRNVMNKVVVDICPTNQEENCEDQCFPSKDKQAESEKYDFRPRTMADREIASCDSQTALIDNSTTNLNNSVYYSPSNVEENKMERAQNTFKFRFSDDHPNVSKERITLASKDDGENRFDVVDAQFSDPLTSKIAGVCEESSSQNDHKFYSLEKNRKGNTQPTVSTPHKNSLDEVSRLKYELQSTQLSVEELQDAISIERQQCLSWMEKHNKVRDSLRLATAEASEYQDSIAEKDEEINKISESRDKLIEDANDLRARIESLSRTNECQRDEIKQLNILYQTESKSASTLEKALNTEKDNFNRMMKSLEVERVRSRAAGDRDSDTIIDLRTALEIEREIRNGISVHHSDGRDCPSFLQGHGAISPLPPSPRSTAAQLRHNKRPQLQKQATCSEHYYKSTPKLFHSASLEKFPGHSTWLKPSLSLGNFPPFKQRYHESFSGTGFSSAESLLEEPEQMIEDSVEVEKNYQGCGMKSNSANVISNEKSNSKKFQIHRQSSLGIFPSYSGNTCQIERLGSPKLKKQSYSTEKYPDTSSLIRPSASMGSIPINRQRFQSRGGLSALHSSKSLLIEEPEIESQTHDDDIRSMGRNLLNPTKSQSGIFQRSLPVLEESVNTLPSEPVRIYQASVFSNSAVQQISAEGHNLKPDLVANTSGAIQYESDCNSQGGVFELTQAFISSSNDDKIEIESLKMKVATLESELKEEKGRVDALKVCLEEKLEDFKSNDEIKIETERHDENKSEQQLKNGKMDSCNIENSGDIDDSLMPFVIAPQRRRHSLWLPSPLNSINSVEPGVVSFDPSKDKANFVKLDDEILTMERRKAESLKTDKMRLEHLLTLSKRKINRITEEVSLLRSRLKIHHQMYSDDPNVIEYRTFYIRDLEAKLDAYRRREWDMSEEAESTAELVKSLQRENTELCDKERRIVQDYKEREGDLEEKLNSNNKNENEEIDRILLGSDYGNGPADDGDDDNDDSRPNLEYVSNVPNIFKSKSATLELEKGKVAIATLESQESDFRLSQKDSSSNQRKHLQRINESLKDQVRLLKNQLSRQRQEFEETTEDLRKEIVIKDSAILSQRYENKTIVSTSLEKNNLKQETRQFSSDKDDHDDCLKKDVSDKEMARKKRSLKLLRLARDKKSLIWQKKYLSKVLEQQYRKQSTESTYTETISRTNAKTLFELKTYQNPGMESDALSSNTESRSNVNIVFGNQVDLTKKKFRIAGSTVVAIIRMQRLAKRWKEKIFDRIMSGGESHDSCCSSSSSRSVSVFSSASSRRSPVSEASSC